MATNAVDSVSTLISLDLSLSLHIYIQKILEIY